MKRSYFKKKKTIPLKRSSFKRKPYNLTKLSLNKPSQKAYKPRHRVLIRKRTIPLHKRIKSLKTKLWEHCKRIIRARYGNTCFTCGKTELAGSSWHTGHFIASSIGGALLRYHLNNLRPQCYRCNIDLSGSGAVFYRKLVEVEGQEYVDDLFILKSQTIKADEQFYLDKIILYASL